MPNRVQLKIIA